MNRGELNFSDQTREQESSLELESIVENFNLVLYNDDFNTFDHVINCLIQVCGYDLMEAEQCTWIVHVNGRCKIKSGNYQELEILCNQMMEKGLSVKIE